MAENLYCGGICYCIMKETETPDYPIDADDDSSISIHDNNLIDEREEAFVEANKEKGLHNKKMNYKTTMLKIIMLLWQMTMRKMSLLMMMITKMMR